VKGLKFPEAPSPELTLSSESNPFTTPVPVPQAAQTVPIPPVAPSSVANASDRILASGSGVGNSAIGFWWVIYIIAALVVCAFSVYGAQVSGDRLVDAQTRISNERRGIFVNQERLNDAERERNRLMPMVAVMGGAAIIVPILFIVFGVVYHRCIASTHILVFETGIEGKGGGRGFDWGDPRLFGFRLAYNQITSVAVAGSNCLCYGCAV